MLWFLNNLLTYGLFLFGGYSSFELQCIVLESDSSVVLCAVIFRPPNYNSTFLHEFCEFLTCIMPSYYHLLLLGDINIHVFCQGQPLVAEFCNSLESFVFCNI